MALSSLQTTGARRIVDFHASRFHLAGADYVQVTDTSE